MPIDNIALINTAVSTSLDDFHETVVVRLQLPLVPRTQPPEVGKYVLFGRVAITNSDGADQNATARMTTLDGGVVLDKVELRLGEDGLSQTITLLGHHTYTELDGRPIIDIRCATYNGTAFQAKLIAIRVDDLEA